MIKDRVVRVKLIKRYSEQRPISYVGKVTAFSENWVILEAKTIMLSRHSSNGAQIDDKAQAMMIPRDNIESIRILPDNFDLDNLQLTTNEQQLVLVVDGTRDAFLGELGEG
jgi:hypothetical protein